MRMKVNNLRAIYNATILRPSILWSTSGRRLYSEASSSAAAAAEKEYNVPETRPPLVDLHGRRHNYLRISLTERCNLRCQYCMPAEGVPLSSARALLSREELTRVVRAMAALGVDKVRLTGGEPTVRADLADIIKDISSIEGIKSIGMTTNGLVLTRRLPKLQRAGLSAINVSLDSLRPHRYEQMARRPGLPKVLAGIDLALQLGYRPVKINTVLMKGFNDDEICDFVEFTRDREVEVRFIEFMPFSGNAWDDSKLVPHRAALHALTARYPHAQPCLPRPNDTARVWQVPEYAGRVGFISSMTNHFCSTCNRLRLTADGNLKVCLFGAAEVSLRDAVRSGADDTQLEALVRDALYNKKPRHAARVRRLSTVNSAENRSHTTWTPSSKTKLTPFSVALPLPTVLLASKTVFSNQLRGYCSQGDSVMTHLDKDGRARMVDVSDKDVTSRVAAAQCYLRVGGRLLRLLRDARLPKGDALTVAQIAGVLGAKKTSDLIPLCHPLQLNSVRVNIHLPKGECADGGDILVHCEVRVESRTGVEMEALTGAAVAALALYDMCKSVDKHMRVVDLRVVRKEGGRSGSWPKGPPPEIKVRDHDTSPLRPEETYAPSNVVYF